MRLFSGMRGKQGSARKEALQPRVGSAPEMQRVEDPFKPEVPVALKRTKIIALAVAGLAEAAELMVEHNQQEAYKEAGFTRDLYEASLRKPTLLPIFGQEQQMPTTAADAAALLYADSMIKTIVGHDGEPTYSAKLALFRQATELVKQSHEEPTLRQALLSAATQEWRITAQKELRETAEDLSKTPIDRAKEALDSSTTGRLSSEHREAVLGMLPMVTKLIVQSVTTVVPGFKLLEHAVREVADSLTENADMVEKTLHRDDRFGHYFTPSPQTREFYMGQLQVMAREKGVEVDSTDLDTFSKLVAAQVLLDEIEAFRAVDGVVHFPDHLEELSRYATIAGVVDQRQSTLRSQTAPTASARRQ